MILMPQSFDVFRLRRRQVVVKDVRSRQVFGHLRQFVDFAAADHKGRTMVAHCTTVQHHAGGVASSSTIQIVFDPSPVVRWYHPHWKRVRAIFSSSVHAASWLKSHRRRRRVLYNAKSVDHSSDFHNTGPSPAWRQAG